MHYWYKAIHQILNKYSWICLCFCLDPPTERLLLKATINVTGWRRLGENLDIEASVLDRIRDIYGADEELNLKLKVFQKWLEQKNPGASWDDVIKALKEMNENTAADRIEEARHQQSSVTGSDQLNTGSACIGQDQRTSKGTTQNTVLVTHTSMQS